MIDTTFARKFQFVHVFIHIDSMYALLPQFTDGRGASRRSAAQWFSMKSTRGIHHETAHQFSESIPVLIALMPLEFAEAFIQWFEVYKTKNDGLTEINKVYRNVGTGRRSLRWTTGTDTAEIIQPQSALYSYMQAHLVDTGVCEQPRQCSGSEYLMGWLATALRRVKTSNECHQTHAIFANEYSTALGDREQEATDQHHEQHEQFMSMHGLTGLPRRTYHDEYVVDETIHCYWGYKTKRKGR